MLPSYHVVYYKNHAIHYMNGVYKIDSLPALGFITITDAMKEVDKQEKDFDDIKKLFENLKPPNEANRKG